MRQFFYALIAISIFTSCTPSQQNVPSEVMTVTGPIDANLMGSTLHHEHIATDFIGAEKVRQPQYPVSLAVEHILPYLQDLKASGIHTFIECTPEHIGRDVLLLKSLSELSGLNIMTNTGYYAAVDKKYLPAHVFTETAEQLSQRWIKEWTDGINGTEIKPGFIKLGVGKNHLDSIEQKIVRAGAMTHLQTGLIIAIHTGSAIAANDEIDILVEEGVDPSALIVVHSQNTSSEKQIQLIKRGAWVSLDGINKKPETIDKYINFLVVLKKENLLSKVLISHDDGWAVVQKEDGSIGFELFGNDNEKPFSTIIDILIPKLKDLKFTQDDIDQLLITNPSEAYKIEVCEL